jgi:hypothetical protein
LLNMVCLAPFSSGASAVCGTRLPNGCAVAIPSRGDWKASAEGDPDLLWGRSPHLARGAADVREGERSSEGRECFWRGTLNADRKANQKGASPVQRDGPQGAERLQSQTAQPRCPRSCHPWWTTRAITRTSGPAARMLGISDEAQGKGRPTRDALPLRPGDGAGAWHVRDLLHAPAPSEEHFGALREAVLERDGFRCRCATRLDRGDAATSSITARPKKKREQSYVRGGISSLRC